MTRLSRNLVLLLLAGCALTGILVISYGILLAAGTADLTISFGPAESYDYLGPEDIGVLPTPMYARNFTITNEGPAAVEGVKVTYTFSDPAGSLIIGSGSYLVPVLAPGETRTFRAEYSNVREKAFDLTVKCRYVRKVV